MSARPRCSNSQRKAVRRAVGSCWIISRRSNASWRLKHTGNRGRYGLTFTRTAPSWLPMHSYRYRRSSKETSNTSDVPSTSPLHVRTQLQWLKHRQRLQSRLHRSLRGIVLRCRLRPQRPQLQWLKLHQRLQSRPHRSLRRIVLRCGLRPQRPQLQWLEHCQRFQSRLHRRIVLRYRLQLQWLKHRQRLLSKILQRRLRRSLVLLRRVLRRVSINYSCARNL